MGALIDSSVIIAAERATLDLDVFMRERGTEEVAIAAITASELLHGVHGAIKPAQRTKRAAFVENLLSVVPVIPFDMVTARVHASLWAELAAKGTHVGAHDLLIAATALAIDYDVATRDKRSFPKIPGLRVVVW